MGAKILFFDVERSTFKFEGEYYDLRLRDKHLPHKGITRDWVLLGAAWGYLDDDRVSVLSIKPDDPTNDYGVTLALHNALRGADILAGHNIDAFDIKTFNTRAIKYNLPPIPPKKTIDTLKIARRYFKFSSNSLAYLARFLGVEAKDNSPDWGLVLSGDEAEIRYMRQYNKQDVIVNKLIYKQLMSFHDTHPDVSKYEGHKHLVCKKCGSSNIKKNGWKYQKYNARRQEIHCKSCNGYSTYTKSEMKSIGYEIIK